MRRPAVGVLLLALVAATLAGCGGSGGGSSAPSGAVSVTDGVTGAAVSDTTVTARPGDPATVQRAGYLRRDTIVARDGILSLWPATVDETYVRTLVYSDALVRNRLSRWPGTTVNVARDFPADVIELVRPWVTLVPSDSPSIIITIDPGNAGFALFPTTARTTPVFSPDERVLLTMMYAHRRPGQVAPDNDQALGTPATGVIRSIAP